jgi:hypothetical protein
MHKLLSIALVVAALAVPAAASPSSLTANDIRTGIRAVLPSVKACGSRTRATGTVKITARVAPDGTPAAVKVKAAPDELLGECVADAVKKARFPATDTGASFSYPFVF